MEEVMEEVLEEVMEEVLEEVNISVNHVVISAASSASASSVGVETSPVLSLITHCPQCESQSWLYCGESGLGHSEWVGEIANSSLSTRLKQDGEPSLDLLNSIHLRVNTLCWTELILLLNW
uniref:Uncharacterized protein n=1 Tax=Knipowitschia caucasica TaxID=637954 RepID=A0AAV2L100_KNICA